MTTWLFVDTGSNRSPVTVAVLRMLVLAGVPAGIFTSIVNTPFVSPRPSRAQPSVLPVEPTAGMSSHSQPAGTATEKKVALVGSKSVSVARVATWSTIGGIIGALVAFAVCAVMETTTAVSFISALAGLALGSIVGATLGGLGRFGGEHAWEETPNRASDPVGGAVVVHSGDDASAEAIARRIIACDGAMDVRVVDEDGFWHAPYSDN